MKLRLTITYPVLHNPLFHGALILMVGLLSYGNSFNVPFVFDDFQNVAENPFIKDLGNFFRPSTFLGNRPVGLLSFALNYHFHGLDVTGYHAVNIAIHIVNAFLVYLLAVMLFRVGINVRSNSSDTSHRMRIWACAAALLFVSHPVHTGAVTYIVQRVTLLATFFYLASLILYLVARSRVPEQIATGAWGGRTCYAASLLCCFAAMKCKEIAFTIPFMITLAEYMFFSARVRTRITLLLPFIAALAVIPLSMLLMTSTSWDILQRFQQSATISRTDYLLTQISVILTYIRLLILPVGQNIDYYYPVSTSFLHLPVMASFLFHVTVVSIAVWLAAGARDRVPSARLVSFGIFWFYITLLVESSVIPLDDVIFEHRLYLPSVGFFLGCISAASELENRWPHQHRTSYVILCLLGVVIITFAVAAYQRNRVWQNSTSLWQDAVRKSPMKSRPHYNLGYFLAKDGNLPEAIREFQTAVRLDPNNSRARNNLGTAYVQIGNISAALREFREAVIVDRTNATAHFNLGYLLAEQGQPKAAINELQKGLQLEPGNQAAISQLTILLRLVQDTPTP